MRFRLVLLSFFAVFAGILGFAATSHAATNIYYSVGQATSSLATGSPTLTITSGAGVFSVAQIGNIGVGDQINYGSGQVAYIAGKTSSDEKHWTLITATGGTPPDVTGASVTSIKRAFTSLAVAIASSTDASHLNTSDLVSANDILNIACYYDSGPDTTSVSIDNILTTGPNNYLEIYTPTSTTSQANVDQRANGVWSTSKYRMEITNGPYAIQDTAIPYMRIDGLQFKIVSTNQADYLIHFGGNASFTIFNDVRVSDSILRGLAGTSDQQIGIFMYNNIAPSSSITMTNNIAYDFKGPGSEVFSGAYIVNADGSEWHAYNNTAYNSDHGFWDYPNVNIQASGYLFDNIAQGSTFGGFSDVPTSTSGYNVSDLGDTLGFDSKSSTTVKFVSTSTPDLHLASSDTAALGAGFGFHFASSSSASDDFNRADGSLGSNWTKPPASEANLVIASDTVKEDAEANHAYAYWSANSFGSDQYSQDTIAKVGQWVGVIARAQAAPTDRFYLAFSFNADQTELYVRYDGTYTPLFDATNAVWNTGDTIRLEATGSNPVHLSLYKNDQLIAVYDDTTYLIEGGSPGIGIFSPSGAGLALDNWEGGDVASSAGTGDDIDHQTRPCGSAWDIGADEYCPPSVTAFTIPSTATSTTVAVNSFTADDSGGDVAGYLLTETSSTPSLGDSGWSASAPSSYTFSSYGTHTLYAWARDGAGNISSATSQSTTLTAPSSGTTVSNGGGTIPPPSAPRDLSYMLIPLSLASSTSSAIQVTISWTAPATYYLHLFYNIYRNNTLIATTSALSYSDLITDASSSSTYAVTATDVSGFTSSYSNTIVVPPENNVTSISGSGNPSANEGTIAALSAQLQSLLQTLKSLLAMRVALITETLSFGDHGSDVNALQEFLVAENKGTAAQALAAHGTTENFATLTRDALIEFQKVTGVVPDSGIFGPITKAKIAAWQKAGP